MPLVNHDLRSFLPLEVSVGCMRWSVLSTVWAVAAVTAAGVSPVAHGATLRLRHRGSDPEPLVVKVDDARFRWGEAGIGAAAGFGGALVLVGGVSLRRAGRTELVGIRRTQEKEER